MSRLRVGVVISEKKLKDFEARNIFRPSSRIEYTFTPLGVELDCILTKVSDSVSLGELPIGVCHVVSPQVQRLTHDRLELATKLRALGVCVPDFSTELSGELCLAKTRKACGPPFTHLMALVEQPGHLAELQGNIPVGEPLFFQHFVSHGELFYKVFVIGTAVRIFARPSVSKQRPRGSIFNSQTLSKESSESEFLSASDRLELIETATKINSGLGLLLFGFDAVRGACGRFFVVDVNYFPTYKEVDDFADLLEDLLISNFTRS